MYTSYNLCLLHVYPSKASTYLEYLLVNIFRYLEKIFFIPLHSILRFNTYSLKFDAKLKQKF